jgi:DnaK suppressor protein
MGIYRTKPQDEYAMKNTNSPFRVLRYQTILLKKQEEIASGLRNHRLVDSLTPVEFFKGIEQRDIDLQRFVADSGALTEIKSALERIADGTFGICDECGSRIPAKRLDALPWAHLCVSCQENVERRVRENAEPQWLFPQHDATGAAA